MTKKKKRVKTKDSAIEWIKDNYPKYEIVYWGGTPGAKSIFKDTERNINFKISFSDLRNKLNTNSEHMFNASKEEIGEKIKNIFLKKYGVENISQLKIIKEKKKQTCLKNYSVEFPALNKQIQEKIKQTNLKRYGVEYPQQNKKIRQKVKQTNLKKYGVECNLSLKENKEKQRETNLKKYSVEYPQQNKKIREKTKQTNLKKYGFQYSLENRQVREKQKQTRIKNGKCISVDGKTLKEWAKNKNLASYVTLLNAYKKQNIHPNKVKSGRSVIEIKIKEFLDNKKINYIHDKKLFGCNKRPDFLLFDYGLIIECDGEYYHQDKEKDIERNKIYKDLGYKVLCFSGKEIVNDWKKVEKKILKNIMKEDDKNDREI